ncbi:MAG: TetR family transcriptional regulator C-terminal domain-containing protein [Desulfomonilaceae bacterium]
MFGNIALELSDSNHLFTQLLTEVFSDWVEQLTMVLRQAQDNGELNELNIAPDVMAKHVVATIEGGIMLSRLDKNANHLRDCLNSLRVFLGIGSG